ncbi:hypothetical protein K437DRAFT_294604 [Tilletiaria anomala UBC 951]|uniref:FAD/NAD(P)-binding domain-containing protein n=1 Tax=Tilletiaria anomala (strain ATCC 24038 / CBS 436.72 / UBC 951) TaxID=1037660 RepID=A0A066VV08_TILAU|nr:uncharacterized protein K437DRAFT_294604 [Tilletiaria anomala UBC 951]KDN45311.1 hypothetical protein K437DRAFT_294604 [Tilletiaria anomala UBC 951]
MTMTMTAAAAAANSGASVPINIHSSSRPDTVKRKQPRYADAHAEPAARPGNSRGPGGLWKLRQPRKQELEQQGHPSAEPATKNVVVLGGSYGGMHAAAVLAARLPPSHRVILIERNSHFNHLYVFPRFSVLPGHEHKAFIPYTSIFKDAPPRGPGQRRQGRANRKEASQAETATEGGSSAAERQAAVRKGLLEFSPVQAREGLPRTRQDDKDGSASTSSASTSSASTSSASHPSSLASSLDNVSPSSVATTSPSAHSSLASSSILHPLPHSEEHHEKQLVSRDEMKHELAEARERVEKKEEWSTFAHFKRLADTDAAVDDASASQAAGNSQAGLSELGKEEDQQAPENVGPEVDVEHGQTGSPHLVLQATVTSITDSHVVVTPATRDDPLFDSLTGGSWNSTRSGSAATMAAAAVAEGKSKLWEISSFSIPYSHLIYALGSHLPDPLRTEARTKREGMDWMKRIQARVEEAAEIVLVGGGALGVEFATDIASVYADRMLRPGEDAARACDAQGRRKKQVTLIHSRAHLLPNFDPRVHDFALARLQQLGVRVVLGERLALTQGCPKGSTVSVEENAEALATQQQQPAPAADKVDENFANAKLLKDTAGHSISAPANDGHHERKIIRTTGGKIFSADLLMLCTGQQPNSGLMAQLSPSSVDPKTRLVRVLPTLQVAVPDPRDAAQMPFEMRPPCGDCDCFLDRKTAGAEREQQQQQGRLDGDALPMKHRRYIEGMHNVYAIGDVADAFGAINAGYQAWSMADVAAENILRDLGVTTSTNVPDAEADADTDANAGADDISGASASSPLELQEFDPTPTMLKLSLGLGKMVFQGGPVTDPAKPDKPPRPEVTLKDDPHDLAVEGVWKFMAKASTDDLYL